MQTETYKTICFSSKRIAEKNRKEICSYFTDNINHSIISYGMDERGNKGYYVEYSLIK